MLMSYLHERISLLRPYLVNIHGRKAEHVRMELRMLELLEILLALVQES